MKNSRNRSVNDAPIFECISMIAIAVGQTMTKYMDALLDPIFACGLSDALTQALVDMAHYIPPARPTIQEKLLDLLSTVLSGRPFQPLGSPHTNVVNPSSLREHREGQPVEHTEVEIALALQTLGSFDFSGKQSHLSMAGSMSSTGSVASATIRHPAYDDATTTGPHGMHEGRRHYIIRNVLEITTTTTAFDPNYKHNAGYILNEFVHDVAIQYAEHDSPAIRKAAALTCCQLFVKDPIVHQVSRHAVHIVSGVIEKLLAVAVADPGKPFFPDARCALSGAA
jgi:FKBP12-rapamycin complex-associated protein